MINMQDYSGSNLNAVRKTNLLASTIPPNLELAAIILKEYLHDSRQEAEVGGRGLKFLKKVGVKQTNVSKDNSVPTEISRNSGDCSTSVEFWSLQVCMVGHKPEMGARLVLLIDGDLVDIATAVARTLVSHSKRSIQK
ncbi:Protein of unknown function DUF3527 [Dillenia turbinata]|uniref:Uncharacterized protein n=1 Tax=Dillenia turbinata TaxID=194707 RepID=A0AAN8UZ23_9MAGN